jgi:hypothetical protein
MKLCQWEDQNEHGERQLESDMEKLGISEELAILEEGNLKFQPLMRRKKDDYKRI